MKRVAGHDEFGIRVVLDRRKAVHKESALASDRASRSGVAYLRRKKAQRETAIELAAHARDTVADVYERLARRARLARRRAASELPVKGGPLLLEAAFLVPKARAAPFKALAAREARTLVKQGYALTISGPWPPYTFVQD